MESKYKISSPDKIIIDRNVIRFGDVVIQFKNISSADIDTKPKKSLVLSAACFLAGMVLVFWGYGVFAFLGILAALFSGIELCRCAVHNASEVRYLFIITNATYMYGIASVQPMFLRDIKDQIEYCMNNNYNKTIVIDVKNSIINDESDIEDM